MPGLGDNVSHFFTNTFPILQTINTDMGAIVIGVETVLGDPTPSCTANGPNAWNGSPASCCCDGGAGSNTSLGVADQIRAVCQGGAGGVSGGTGQWPCDPNRIWVFGHSAGAVQAFRFTCDHADLVAATFTITGSALADAFDPACSPSQPVSFVHMHGTADTYFYDNSTGALVGNMTEPYVSVETTRTSPQRTATIQQMLSFGGENGCSSYSLTASGLPYDSATGNATDVYNSAGCTGSINVQLWKDNGGVHIPTLTTQALSAIEAWYEAHPK
jgi:hypothetical protein